MLYFRKREPWKNPYISGNGNSKKASYTLGGNLQCPKNKQKKSAFKKFLVSYDGFAIFVSVEDMEISCEGKNESLIMLTL